MPEPALDFDTSPYVPANVADYGIGIVGAGGIVRHGHLPAYRKFGFRVAGIASRTAKTLESLDDPAPRFAGWRELIDSPDVRIVDVTYPFDEDRLAIVEAAAAAGKHIMMQKPFAHSMENAREMAAIAERHGVKLAVNQNARWCPQYRAAKLAIERGLIGAPYFAMHTMMSDQDSQEWFAHGWYANEARFQLLEYTVHHLDLVRYWLDREAVSVKASIARKPGQRTKGEMLTSVTIEFGDALAVVTDNNAAHPGSGLSSEFRIDGTEGAIAGCAVGAPALTIWSDKVGGMAQPALTGSWFPDGFAGTMGELIAAIDEGREPSISGRDNLATMQLVFDAYGSAA